MGESGDLVVTPEQLVVYGALLVNRSNDAREAFESQHLRLAQAAEGWASASRNSLQNALDRWRATTRQLSDSVESHGHAVTGAGYQ